jgi:hypothetical protein
MKLLRMIFATTKAKIKIFFYLRARYRDPSDMVTKHFRYWAAKDHPNLKAFEIVFRELNGSSAHIIETGTSAWGTDSTRLWDRYVSHFGGSFQSVDIRMEPAKRLGGQVGNNTQLVVSDSIDFLKSLAPYQHIDLFFLDSWDVDWDSPLDSANHGLREFEVIRPKLKAGCILFIDDTPSSLDWIPTEYWESARNFENQYGVLPGKGAFILKILCDELDVEFLHHDYSVVIKFP